MDNFTTITNQEKAEILQLLEELEGAFSENFYITDRVETITKIINKYEKSKQILPLV